MNIATETDTLDSQMYEVPVSFLKFIFGKTIKGSCCYFKDDSVTLDEDEIAMHNLYCERAQIIDGERVLDLGCGQGPYSSCSSKKGYDASGDNDDKGFDETELSDDEKDAEYKRMQRTTKRGKDDKRSGNQEFVGSKRSQVKGGSQKDLQAVATPARVSAVQPEMVGLGPPCGLGQLQSPPVAASFGCGSCSCSHAGQPVAPPQALFQLGSMWLHGMPAMQHPMGPLNNGLQMGHMPFPQQHDYHCHHQNQQQQHLFTGFPNGIPFQQRTQISVEYHFLGKLISISSLHP